VEFSMVIVNEFSIVNDLLLVEEGNYPIQ